MDPRRETIRALEQNGFLFTRHGSNHDIYVNPTTGVRIPIKRHDFNENDAKYVRKEAGLPKR